MDINIRALKFLTKIENLINNTRSWSYFLQKNYTFLTKKPDYTFYKSHSTRKGIFLLSFWVHKSTFKQISSWFVYIDE